MSQDHSAVHQDDAELPLDNVNVTTRAEADSAQPQTPNSTLLPPASKLERTSPASVNVGSPSPVHLAGQSFLDSAASSSSLSSAFPLEKPEPLPSHDIHGQPSDQQAGPSVIPTPLESKVSRDSVEEGQNHDSGRRFSSADSSPVAILASTSQLTYLIVENHSLTGSG